VIRPVHALGVKFRPWFQLGR